MSELHEQRKKRIMISRRLNKLKHFFGCDHSKDIKGLTLDEQVAALTNLEIEHREGNLPKDN